MTLFEQALREALIAFGLLMIPVGIAVVWCVGRGIRAEILERREMRRLRGRGSRISGATKGRRAA